MKTKPVAGLTGFPFSTYDEFIDAHKREQALVWVRYDFRTVWEFSDLYGKVFHLLVLGFPILAAMTFGFFAFRNQDYVLLLGIPACLVGLLFSSSNVNMIQGCLPFTLFLLGVFISPFAGVSYGVAGFSAAVSWAAASLGHVLGHLILLKAMTRSEETFRLLCSRKVITSVARVHASSSQ